MVCLVIAVETILPTCKGLMSPCLWVTPAIGLLTDGDSWRQVFQVQMQLRP